MKINKTFCNICNKDLKSLLALRRHNCNPTPIKPEFKNVKVRWTQNNKPLMEMNNDFKNFQEKCPIIIQMMD